MQTLGSAASVVAAIREEAEALIERLEETTAADLASISATAAAADVEVPEREARLAMARLANEERVARQEWEGRRKVIEQREAWLGEVVAAAQQRWRDVDSVSRRASLDALLREALSRMPPGACDVAVRAGEADLVTLPDARVSSVPIAGGCIVTNGQLSFDNSYEARARRLEPEWRAALSRMYAP